MKNFLSRLSLALSFLALSAGQAWAALIVNPAAPITHQIKVQIIQTFNDDGSTPATVFGNAAQRAEIEGYVDTIWAQAGIDVLFMPTINSYNNTFARVGTSDPRPISDLSTIVNDAGAPPKSADASVINMFFVENVPGFPAGLSENTAAGLAFVGGNGITQYVGDNLLTFTTGREVIASVVSHEIGHNVGLFHITEAENLMQSGGSPDQGERLNATQISTALQSSLVQPQAVPEPGSLA